MENTCSYYSVPSVIKQNLFTPRAVYVELFRKRVVKILYLGYTY